MPVVQTAPLHAFLEYTPCRPGFTPTKEQWGVHHLTKLLKTGSANRVVDLQFVQQGLRLSPQNHTTAIDLSGLVIAHMIQHLADPQDPVALIPIPSSTTVLNSAPVFLAARIADAAAIRNKGFVHSPILRFSAVRNKSSVSGNRNPGLLKQAMVFTNGVVFPKRAILVDDVYTTGAHMKAAASLLHANGCKVLAGACVLRTAAKSVAGAPSVWLNETFDYY